MSVSKTRRRAVARRHTESKHESKEAKHVTSTTPPPKKSRKIKTAGSFCVMTLDGDFHVRMSYDAPTVFQDACMNTERTAFVHNNLIASRHQFTAMKLCQQSQLVLSEPNAGGASEKSEALSFELLKRAFGCQLIKTEMAIGYEWEGWSKKTDYLCSMFNTKLGVSVTRAMAYRGHFRDADAYHLLCKKLYGVQMSSRDVVEHDRWNKQVLHIFCAEDYMIRILQRQYNRLCIQQPDLVGNTVVLVTRTHNAPFIYTNK